MEKLYIRFKGRVLGPITIEKASEMMRRGQITRQHEVSPDGLAWQPAANVPELFAGRGDQKGESSEGSDDGSTVPAAKGWYANFDGANQGPTDEAGIKQWIGMGKVTRSTLVWREGMANWSEAGVAQPTWFVGVPLEPSAGFPNAGWQTPYHPNPYAQQAGGNPNRRTAIKDDDDEPSPVSGGMKVGIAILSFFVPIVGLIMGLIYMNDEHPDKKEAGKLWLLCAGIMVGLNLLCCCGYMVLVAAASSARV